MCDVRSIDRHSAGSSICLHVVVFRDRDDRYLFDLSVTSFTLGDTLFNFSSVVGGREGSEQKQAS